MGNCKLCLGKTDRLIWLDYRVGGGVEGEKTGGTI